MIRPITDHIKYIGVDDPDIDLFESQYVVPAGMCYNSYLIEDEKIAVLDTSDRRTGEAWLQNLREALAGRTPHYLVVHHLEPDHSALILRAVQEYPSLTVVASAMALKFMAQFFEGIDLEGRSLAVKEGDVLPLGKHSLRFVAAPMVHWPEVMVSYDEASGTLFSADGFGKFGTMDADPDDWACEARRYYFNICGKYGPQVQALLQKAATLPHIDRICALHGPILEGEAMAEALRLYDIWSKYEVETPGVFIAHASIHGGTKYAAEFLAGLLEAKGCPKVAVADLTRDDQAEAIEDAFRYGNIVLAASSYDGDLFPPMYNFLHKLQLKGYQRRRVALIENGTWAPAAARVMRSQLEGMKDIEIVEPVVSLRSTMHSTDVEALDALADAILK